MHQCVKFILFWNDTLHVSDGLSVHQEFKAVHKATGICQTGTAVCKQMFDEEGFNLKEAKRTGSQERVSDGDYKQVWENIKANVKTSAKESLGLHELNQHKPWFDEECFVFLDQRKEDKMQWLQDLKPKHCR